LYSEVSQPTAFQKGRLIPHKNWKDVDFTDDSKKVASTKLFPVKELEGDIGHKVSQEIFGVCCDSEVTHIINSHSRVQFPLEVVLLLLDWRFDWDCCCALLHLLKVISALNITPVSDLAGDSFPRLLAVTRDEVDELSLLVVCPGSLRDGRVKSPVPSLRALRSRASIANKRGHQVPAVESVFVDPGDETLVFIFGPVARFVTQRAQLRAIVIGRRDRIGRNGQDRKHLPDRLVRPKMLVHKPRRLFSRDPLMQQPAKHIPSSLLT
jgi:hypothetical protein